MRPLRHRWNPIDLAWLALAAAGMFVLGVILTVLTTGHMP